MVTPSKASSAAFERGEAEDRRRAGEEAVDAGGGRVIVDEGEGLGMAHPAAQGRDQPLLQMLGDVEEGRRARAAVQIFVAAADRELGARLVEVRAAPRRRCGSGPRPSSRRPSRALAVIRAMSKRSAVL